MKTVHLVLISVLFALAVAQTCTCVQGMIFDSSATPPKCKLCCSIANVIKTAPALSVGTCNCEANYTWNSATHSCDQSSAPSGSTFCFTSGPTEAEKIARCGFPLNSGLIELQIDNWSYDLTQATSKTWTEISGSNPAVLTVVNASKIGNSS